MSPFKFSYGSLLLLLICLLITSSPVLAAAPSLQVMGSSSVPNPINLTTIAGSSTIDWKDWAAGVEYVSGSGQISNYSIIGGGTSALYIYGTPITWSNGTIASPTSPNDNSLYISPPANVTQGYSFTIPADTNVRTLYFYGSVRGTGTLTATISDGSSAAYTDSSYSNSNVVYIITYSAASANQNLTVTWTTNNNAQWDFVEISSAVLASGNGPLSITTASLPTATQYQPYSATPLEVFGGNPPFTWSVTSVGSTLPEGLTLNPSTGVISATAVGGIGGYQFQVQVTDSSVVPVTATKMLTINVNGASTVNVNGVSTPAVAQDANGVNVIDGCNIFPDDNIFHQRVDSLPVDTSPAAPIPAVYQTASIKPFFGSNAGPNGIPFIQVPSNQAPVNIQWLDYGDESDPSTDPTTNPTSVTYPNVVPQYPFPSNAPVEGSANAGINSDRHVLTLQSGSTSGGCQLYEVWQGTYVNGTIPWTASNGSSGTYTWTAANGAHWNLNSDALRPLGWTSGDAAGLPIMPLTVNYDEVASGTVTHPIRFTLNHMLNYIVWPGRHAAGIGSCSTTSGPMPVGSLVSQSNPPVSCTFSGPSGEIYRLKANVDTSACNSFPQSSVILKAMKQYGIILADNGDSGGLIGTPDARWNNTDLACLTNFNLSQFEPVDVSSIQVSPDSGATVSPTGPAVSMTAVNINPAGTIVLTATASENNGTVTGVVFNNVINNANTPILGSVISTPPTYTMTLYNQTPGATEIFTASATDSKGKNSSSEESVVTVNASPSFTTQPINQSVVLGQVATFSTVAAGTAPLTYQWYLNNNAISSQATGSSYTTPATMASDNGNIYTVVVTNTAGSITSNPVTLTVNVPPSITTQPLNQSVAVGNTATFNVVASGTAPLTYQWQKCLASSSGNCTNVGTNNSSYTMPATGLGDSNSVYTVTVSNAFGSANSNGAILIVSSSALPTYTLNASANNAAYGVVSQSFGGIVSSGPYSAGTVVTLTATPANGYQFSSWSGTVSSASNNPTTVAMNTNENVTANFILNPNVPSAPVNLTALGVSDTEVNLTWDRVGTGETSITVWRSTGGTYAKLTVLPAGSNIFTDTSCFPSTSYSYQVTADNAGGSSLSSSTATATTKASPSGNQAAPAVTASVLSPSAITLSWLDNTVSVNDSWFIERSTNDVSYTVVALAAGKGIPTGSTNSYTDTPLSPSTTYYYRIRLISWDGISNYSVPVPVTTQALAGIPTVPANLMATVNSGTSSTLNWTDTNNATASYLIETAANPWDGLNQPWTQIAQTAIGASSYNMTTTAQSILLVRIRAKNGAGDSGYTQYIDVRTASAGTGSPKVYNIGPGQTYTRLGALNWSTLGPGDTVNIYPNRDSNGNIIPYYERPVINERGTATAPITITGIPDPTTGALPIIDGTNAVTTTDATVNGALQDLFLVLIGANAGWSPGYLTLSNLEIRNAYDYENDTVPSGGSKTFTASDGSTQTYNEPSCIYITDGDHITIKGNIIHGCNDGVFGAGQGDPRNLEEVTLDSNYIYGNGTISNDLTHATYLEGLNTLYQYNKYGLGRTGAGDNGDLKDRGAGTVIRYNSMTGGGHLVDLVEAQNYSGTTLLLPSYHQTYVYGNVFYNTTAFTIIHYCGDQGLTQGDRKGILHFYNNTVYNTIAGANPFYMTDDGAGASCGASLDARNNILFSPTGDQQYLLPSWGQAYFGNNWVSPGWSLSNGTFTGNVDGAGIPSGSTLNLLTNTSNNPGFVSAANQNFQLLSTSPVIGQSSVLSADDTSILSEYSAPTPPVAGTQPMCLSGAPDLGALQSSSTTSCSGGTSSVPTVSLSGTSTVPGTVVLTATAFETNGTITGITFNSSICSNNTCGTTSNSPYTITLTNIPAGTYTFTATATDKNNVSTTSAPVSVTVNPSPTTYTLNITASNGSVAQSVNGVASTGPYAAGTVVTLTATAASGYQFNSWSGMASAVSTNPTSITMNANESITANFIAQTETISASAGTGGTISPSGSVSVNYGANQIFTVTPNAGYTSTLTVDGNAVTLTNNTYTLSKVTSVHTVSASFALQTDTITASAGTGGTISPSGSVSVNYGYDETFTVTPSAGYTVSQVLVDGNAAALANGQYTFTNVVKAHTIAASFSLQSETITATAGAGGSISPSGTVNVNYGSTQTFTVTPAAGYTPTLTVDGKTVTITNNTYNLTNVTTTHTVAASFTLQTEVITASAGMGGSISPSGTTTVNYGANQTFTVTPNAGYTPTLTVDGNAVTLTNNTYTLSNVTTTHTVVANFSLQIETITASAGTGGSISPSGTVNVNYGSNQAFTVTPAIGYTPALMVDGATVTLTNNAYTLTNVTTTHAVAASFSPIIIPKLNLIISPSGWHVLVPDSTIQYAANVAGVTWMVNGIVGGNSTVGTISASGLYTSPSKISSNLNAVEIEAAKAGLATAGTYLGLQPEPLAPTNLTASVSAGKISLNWSASTGATSYNIQRLSNWNVGYVTIATGITTTQYTDTSLTNATGYYYEVLAVNAGGKSSPSNQVSAVATISGNYTLPVYVYGSGTVQYSYLSSSGKTNITNLSPGSSITVPAGTTITMTSTPKTGYIFYRYFIPFNNIDYTRKRTVTFTVNGDNYIDVYFLQRINKIKLPRDEVRLGSNL